MYHKALSIYYSLAIFVLGTALFVFYPSNPTVTAWQDGVKHQFGIAAEQTIGDQPWFTEVGQVYDGVANFYGQSATAMTAMIDQPQSDADIYFVFGQVYHQFAQAFATGHTSAVAGNVAGASIQQPAVVQPMAPMPKDFMTQDPVYNLVPDSQASVSSVQPAVSGAMVMSGNPVNSTDEPWVTVQDNDTGQLYCLAVYDGTVNKYIGPCKNDYH